MDFPTATSTRSITHHNTVDQFHRTAGDHVHAAAGSHRILDSDAGLQSVHGAAGDMNTASRSSRGGDDDGTIPNRLRTVSGENAINDDEFNSAAGKLRANGGKVKVNDSPAGAAVSRGENAGVTRSSNRLGHSRNSIPVISPTTCKDEFALVQVAPLIVPEAWVWAKAAEAAIIQQR